MDYKKIAETLIELSGGQANISSVTHCATRLRFFINDKDKMDVKKIEHTKPVLGVVFKGDELQIVLAQNVIPVYTEAAKLCGEKEKGADSTTKNRNKESVLNKAAGFISASVTPLIPGLCAGGMLKLFLVLATLFSPAAENTQTYVLLSQLANVPFYFMPVFVAYGASKKLGSTPLYAMAVMGAMVSPDFVTLVGTGEPLAVFGIPVMLVSYATSLLPALLVSILAYYVEKLLTKVVPGVFKMILVGTGTIVISYVAGITILGPIGDMAGKYLVAGLNFIHGNFAPLALGLLTAIMPVMVMTGMHHAVTPFSVQAFAAPGYDNFFRPSMLLHNVAQGGACLGVALRTKNKVFRSECFSLAVSCILAGVTEPAIYGVNLKLKKPLIGAAIGGGAGGFVAGLMGATAYVYGWSSILGIPLYQKTALAITTAIIVSIVTAALAAFLLGFEDPVEESDHEIEGQEPVRTIAKGNCTITAVSDAEIIPMTEVKDKTFAKKMIGDGIAFELKGDTVCAPVSGKLVMLYPTGHAFGIESDDGVQLLVHIGVDTVKMNGKGFQPLSVEGKWVEAGDPIVKVERQMIRAAGYDLTTMLIITENNGREIHFKQSGSVKKGEMISE